MQRLSIKYPQKSHRFFIVAIAILGVLLTVGLVFHIKTLNERILNLEDQTAQMVTKAEAFKRSYCSEQYSIYIPSSTNQHSIKSAGRDRTYQVHTPVNYDPSVRYPVIISFDGIGGSGGNIKNYSGIDGLPVIAVYPDSIKGKSGFTAWQGAPYSIEGDYDVQFVREMLEALPAQYCVDATKVFAAGMSNGGGFAEIIGCRMPDKIKAVAGMSGAYYAPCSDEHPRTASLLVVHGAKDRQVPIKGSRARNLPEVTKWVYEEAERRHCGSDVKTAANKTTITYDWINCSDDSILRLVVLKEQGHGWLKLPQTRAEMGAPTANYIWKFFEEAMYV